MTSDEQAGSRIHMILRPATSEDAELLFRWVNEEGVRRSSFNTATIAFEDHMHWLGTKLASSDSFIYIAEVDDQKVGQIRFDRMVGDHFTIDYSIDASQRGKGLGAELLKTGIALFARTQGPISLEGRVKGDNTASGRAFLSNAFRLQKCDGDVHMFTREVP